MSTPGDITSTPGDIKVSVGECHEYTGDVQYTGVSKQIQCFSE